MFARVCGLDVHRKTVTACVIVSQPDGRPQKAQRTFKTTTAGLQALAEWLASFGVTHVAMESTGVYWKPVYNVLSDAFEVWVVNARHVAQVPGRKTDDSDACWLAKLMRYGLLNRSFIPPVEQRDLRDLTRYRTRLIEARTATANRVHKVLEDANIKLGAVVSDIQGVSARRMLDALIAEDTEAEAIAELAKGRLRAKIPELVEALTGHTREHHRFLLRELLGHLDELNARIATLDARIHTVAAPQARLMERLMTIPGVGRRIAEIILAEVGWSSEPFASAKHLASWACVAPGNHISANKRKSGRTRRGQQWLRPALIQAAWAASRTHDTYLAAQFHRLRARRGGKVAAGAVAHSIITIVYHLLADPEAVYRELGGDYFLKHNQEAVQRRAIKQLEALGLQVSVSPAAA
jgi:transposase